GGGCMDADTAYCEAVGSIQAMAGLQYLGLPLPQDRFGAVLRYQTDHDETGRATSCGPRTSRLMVRVLAAEALRLGVRCLPKCEAVQLLTTPDGSAVAGVLAIDHGRHEDNGGFCLLLAPDVVLATGGPGELYRDSVYPRHCYGALGMALEAGLAVCNLTESQFGIGTRRQEFPWNLSGTYAQVMPRIWSEDAEGRSHEFLGGYYRSTRELAANTFRKGYQWPFHATRMLDFRSSLLDLAVHEQVQQGRTVYMDFLRNPAPGPDGAAFRLDDLDTDVHAYLAANQALQELPIERLQRMNPLAIELYRMHGTDLTSDPLPFAVNNQHMNGGIAVDSWGMSSLRGCYAVGEVAGTHGVTRPGGAALNAGQVGGLRCAEHIAARPGPGAAIDPTALASQVRSAADIRGQSGQEGALATRSVRTGIQARMSDHAGFICQVAELPAARDAARSLRRRIWQQGVHCRRPSQWAEAFRWRHLALLSEAVLDALVHYAGSGGGSRGARAYCTSDGDQVPQAHDGPLAAYRFRREDPAHRSHKLQLQWQGDGFHISEQPVRAHEDLAAIVFERDWQAYLTDAIHDPDFQHRR
ncbi:MAG: oxidoreductase, partial [Planctomycetota bacterium]